VSAASSAGAPAPIRKGWAAYAAILTALIVAGEVANLAQGKLDPRTLANWVVTAVLLVATWGYALRRRIGAARYWAPAFWVVLLATLVTLVPVVIAGAAGLYVAGVSLLLLAPAFWAAWRYAYRSPDLWPSTEVPR
jgi:hypothetical protein